MTEASATCRSCQRPIMWVVTSRGKKMPLDAKPDRGGSFVLQDGPEGQLIARYVKAGERLDEPHYTSHFATCPNAAKWRRGG